MHCSTLECNAHVCYSMHSLAVFPPSTVVRKNKKSNKKTKTANEYISVHTHLYIQLCGKLGPRKKVSAGVGFPFRNGLGHVPIGTFAASATERPSPWTTGRSAKFPNKTVSNKSGAILEHSFAQERNGIKQNETKRFVSQLLSIMRATQTFFQTKRFRTKAAPFSSTVSHRSETE